MKGNAMEKEKRALYSSPLGLLMLESDGACLTRLDFVRGDNNTAQAQGNEDAAIFGAIRWLDTYFAGGVPGALPPLKLHGTDFQKAVWTLLLAVPYGQTTTYGALAKQLEQQLHKRMSAQAVGGAVGRNPIVIIVPCHRVLGADGSLTGYAGGLDKKQALLNIEGIAR